MTDLNERFAAMLAGEPDTPDDLERVVRGGRRALRRRTALTTVAGTAGTAAVTAAIVVPITYSAGGGTDNIVVSTQPTPTPTPSCNTFWVSKHKGKLSYAAELRHAYRSPRSSSKIMKVIGGPKREALRVCYNEPGESGGLPASPSPTPSATMPAYRYNADPQTIADGFASELASRVKGLGFTIIYTRPFAQESSTLEKGHPSYYDGNVDVQLPNGPADIGVQVTHTVTEQVPLPDPCNAPGCSNTTLADGSLMQISHIHAGSGGAEVIAVEIHHPDGLVVEAQESNYAFGPAATRARSSQPLTIEQLTQLAEDPAFAF